MTEIKLTKDEIDGVVAKVKTYFNDELNQEIGGFEAEFLLDFFAQQIGPHFYNKGLADANALFTKQAEEISYQIQDLEKSTT